jgi:hypothetical protein
MRELSQKLRLSNLISSRFSASTPVATQRADGSCCTPSGSPYDGYTLGPVIADLENLIGVALRCIHGAKGYRGDNYSDLFKVWISG